ncbi:hypothetical protein Patl1_10415 [Pistacia atlantica]|uniref:Uncharacterized protein n=1 Tax=Pistacia atlantica TaxID=434234 RepID=A0ACC1A4D2_9ROSI|nr:hypothetical protein Patl1_10415 [Pistacia atlantica]
MFPLKHLVLVSVIALGYLCMQIFAVTRLHQDEGKYTLILVLVEVLNQIVKTMGANWTVGSDACEDYVDIKPVLSMDPRRNITCDCGFENNTCHIIALKILLFGLPGTLPTELVHLPYLQEIDFAYNYLSGPIPREWASMQLTYISLFGNRLSGNMPSFLGNITGLTYLDLEVNQFSGTVPSELGKLVHLETLRLSSNRLTGNLPMELAELKNLTDFRINDNNFNGSIPEYIKNWNRLQRLEILGSGLDGPIPSSISVLENLIQLKISDITGARQAFPELRNMSNIIRMDLSFNKLSGELPYVRIYGIFKFIFLSGNFLSGNIPKSILKKGSNVDLSYNNFTWQSVEQSACPEKPNLNLNLFRSSSVEKNIGALPCMDDFKCQRYRHSLYINCGGETVKINGRTFEGDAGVGGGVATFYFNANTNWGFSSTGDFMDDDDEQNTNYIANLQSSQISELYSNARIAPLLLTYVGYCLENGSYTVSLHFAEIQFTNDKTYRSLGRRKFDIYVQDRLVEKDFDIEAIASGVLKPVIKEYKANVTSNILEIRFIWAGKGTTAIPKGGVYGPLISAISVDPNFKPHYGGEKRKIVPIVVSIGVVGFFFIFLAFGILCRRYFTTNSGRETDFKGLDDLHTSYFTLKQIKAATNNFDSSNKIGEGGFGPVYKAFNLQQRGKLRELVDANLGSDFDKVEAERMIKVALVCTNASPSLRPTMSEVVSMLEGTSAIPDAVPVAGSYGEDLRFKTLKDHHMQMKNQADFSVSTGSWPAASSDIQKVCEVNEESYLMFKAVRDNHIQSSMAQTSISYASWTASSSKSSHD